MITKKELTSLKRTYGPKYVDKITEQLADSGYSNRKGHPYSSWSVRKVVNGRSHSVLVSAIRDMWQQELQRQEEKIAELMEQSERIAELN